MQRAGDSTFFDFYPYYVLTWVNFLARLALIGVKVLIKNWPKKKKHSLSGLNFKRRIQLSIYSMDYDELDHRLDLQNLLNQKSNQMNQPHWRIKVKKKKSYEPTPLNFQHISNYKLQTQMRIYWSVSITVRLFVKD